MKSFANTSFFRLFDHVVRPPDLMYPTPTWSRDGVDWTHVRHGFRGVDHEFTMDVFTGTRPGKKSWSIMVVHEGWWVGHNRDPIRTTQWAHMVSGNRVDALAWFQAQQADTLTPATTVWRAGRFGDPPAGH
jgi:hypothetical protein